MGERITETIQSDTLLLRVYHLLFQRFGPQHWWPGETPFEIIVGAILTQNTSWTNVARAIDNLKRNKKLTPLQLHKITLSDLSELIRPAGYFNIKAGRLKEFTGYLFQKYCGDLHKMFDKEPEVLRQELLNIRGIGPETADSILLYAANKPIFVIDAYTRRIFSRHGFLHQNQAYESIQSFFMKNLPESVDIYNEYHALIVRLAKEHCKKKPVCRNCPLENMITAKPEYDQGDICRN